MQSKKERNRIISNLWTARIIPLILTGVVGYATYVLVALLSVNYLLKKRHDHRATIPILAVYFILFVLMAASFLRLVYITTFDPPYIPLGSSALPARRDRISNKENGRSRNKQTDIAMGEYELGDISGGQHDPDSPGLELFYTKDVFVCEMDGRPGWCSPCANWKPDRAHHCSSSGRCIAKMDHFCPWVGGPVGENNFKFFIQFNGYAALYCIHILVVMAFYIHQQMTTEGEHINRHFAAVLGLAIFFGMFTGSMFSTCIDLTMNNLTQVERLGSKSRTYRLAVLKPSPKQFDHVIPHGSPQPAEITYPLEAGQRSRTRRLMQIRAGPNPHKALQNPGSHQGVPPVSTGLPPVSESPPGGVPPTQPGTSVGAQRNTALDDTSRPTKAISARDILATRTFGILMMNRGDNPWDLGSRLLNLETVMGTNFLDYFLPIRRSPCCNHEDPESYYYLGPVVDVVKSKFYFMDAKDIRAKGGPQRPKH